LPKADRAALHEAFTEWLERTAGERVGEYEAILGYHLEQACRLRGELGPAHESDAERARKAAGWLAKAGRRCAEQGDDRSAVGLLERAVALAPVANDDTRARLLVDLGRSLQYVGEFARADAVLSDAVEATDDGNDRSAHGEALLARMYARFDTGRREGAEELAEKWVSAFTERGEHRGLAWAHKVLGLVRMAIDRSKEGRQSFQLAWQHACQTADTRLRLDCLGNLRMSIIIGPTPTSECLRLFRELAPQVASGFDQARLDDDVALVLPARCAFTESRAPFREQPCGVPGVRTAHQRCGARTEPLRHREDGR